MWKERWIRLVALLCFLAQGQGKGRGGLILLSIDEDEIE